jgi:hypothetical protein
MSVDQSLEAFHARNPEAWLMMSAAPDLRGSSTLIEIGGTDPHRGGHNGGDHHSADVEPDDDDYGPSI